MELTELKPQSVVSGKDIEKYLPHRFENVLIDKIQSFADNPEKLLCVTELTITEHDHQGRNIFLVADQAGKQVYNPCLFPEHLALGALGYLNTIRGSGWAALFSTISNFQHTGEINAGEKMSAKIFLKRGKGAFETFSGKIYNSKGEQIAENDIMAFIVKVADAPAPGDGEKKKSEPPLKDMSETVDRTKFNDKPKAMFFVDKLVHFDIEKMVMVTSYTYPKEHPFVKGHFPGNPIMMGVCQWMSAGDALDIFAYKLRSSGKGAELVSLTADIELIKADGTLVTEIKDIRKDYKFQGDKVLSRLVTTRKIGFRDMVTPGTEIFQRVTNVRINEAV
jgi:3-hydroxymyristoyl/3-hydroxydecanoyl-(acyl carrier protein) dehydratase